MADRDSRPSNRTLPFSFYPSGLRPPPLRGGTPGFAFGDRRASHAEGESGRLVSAASEGDEV